MKYKTLKTVHSITVMKNERKREDSLRTGARKTSSILYGNHIFIILFSHLVTTSYKWKNCMLVLKGTNSQKYTVTEHNQLLCRDPRYNLFEESILFNNILNIFAPLFHFHSLSLHFSYLLQICS